MAEHIAQKGIVTHALLARSSPLRRVAPDGPHEVFRAINHKQQQGQNRQVSRRNQPQQPLKAQHRKQLHHGQGHQRHCHRHHHQPQHKALTAGEPVVDQGDRGNIAQQADPGADEQAETGEHDRVAVREGHTGEAQGGEDRAAHHHRTNGDPPQQAADEGRHQTGGQHHQGKGQCRLGTTHGEMPLELENQHPKGAVAQANRGVLGDKGDHGHKPGMAFRVRQTARLHRVQGACGSRLSTRREIGACSTLRHVGSLLTLFSKRRSE